MAVSFCHVDGDDKLFTDYLNDQNTVTINVSGLMFETTMEILDQFPKTLLGNPEKRAKYYDPERKEFYFNRNRPSFNAILCFYKNKEILAKPFNVPLEVFTEELQFFELGDTMLEHFRPKESTADEDMAVNSLTSKFRKKLWLIVENPQSSTTAHIFAIVSFATIIVSVAMFCIETLPQMMYYVIENGTTSGNARITFTNCPVPHTNDASQVVNAVCVSWFIIELILRFYASPQRKWFFLQILNIIDLVAILPFFIRLHSVLRNDCETGDVASLPVLKAIRLGRVFILFRVYGHSDGIRTLVSTVQSIIREISLLIFFLSMGALLFSSAVYYLDGDKPGSPFLSIPHACWWAFITLTTVGYGDMIPVGVSGKIVGALCAVAGAFSVGLFVPTIMANFNYHWRMAKEDIYETDYMKKCVAKMKEDEEGLDMEG